MRYHLDPSTNTCLCSGYSFTRTWAVPFRRSASTRQATGAARTVVYGLSGEHLLRPLHVPVVVVLDDGVVAALLGHASRLLELALDVADSVERRQRPPPRCPGRVPAPTRWSRRERCPPRRCQSRQLPTAEGFARTRRSWRRRRCSAPRRRAISSPESACRIRRTSRAEITPPSAGSILTTANSPLCSRLPTGIQVSGGVALELGLAGSGDRERDSPVHKTAGLDLAELELAVVAHETGVPHHVAVAVAVQARRKAEVVREDRPPLLLDSCQIRMARLLRPSVSCA